MKIFSIGLGNPYTNKIQKTNNIANNIGTQAVTKPYALDSVSFGRVAGNAEKMRSLFKYGVIDYNTGKYCIDPDWFTESLQNGLYNRSIQSIVKVLKPLSDRLHDVEAELFSMIETISKTHPLYRLDDTIQMLAPQAQIKLRNIQRPIFEKLKSLSHKMPPEQKATFDELMETTEKQLENKPIPYKFSKKEFRYKLERIYQDIKRRGINDEIKTMKTLINMSERIPYTPSGRNFSHRKTKFNPNKSISQVNIIRQIDNYFARSVLKGDKSLNDLLSDTKMQIFNIPMVIPFTRKTFIHELQTITDTLPNKKLAREMMKETSKLPTAQNEVSAFIMKSSRYSPAKIGHDLLYGSVGDIDHLEPWSLGGPDALENYAFTTHAPNEIRGNRVIPKWLKKNPQTIENSQKSIDRLIELYKEGVFTKEDFTPWYIINFARRMEKLAGKEYDLHFDLGTLPQELKTR